jgi:uncharacterized DUF497 family protein
MILFEWDERKAAANRRKHGISFENAMQAFDDPGSVSEPDRIVDGELRWQTIGLVKGAILLMVAHTISEEGRDEIIRIISARRADRMEHIRYEQNRQKDSW